MNYNPLINELKARHSRVVQAIAALELIEHPKSTRGRKPGMPLADASRSPSA